jgi:hypothetical protein
VADRVLIPLPGIGTLVFDSETYRAALAEGAKLVVASAPTNTVTHLEASGLVTAEELAKANRISRVCKSRLCRSL